MNVSYGPVVSIPPMLQPRKPRSQWRVVWADFVEKLARFGAGARHLIAAWRVDYNHHRPHSSLDGLTLREYHQRSEKDQTLKRAN
jgi:hypothetical protein